jgi:hypothetical protein
MRIAILCCLLAPTMVGCTTSEAPTPVTPHSSTAGHFIRVSADKKSFVLLDSTFIPWGFNYDHDRSGRLIETYWMDEWNTVVADFQEMKALGANTVRVHLQVGKFMDSETKPNQQSLHQLARLLTLSEQTGLHLDITGLGCYDKKEVPQWYNDLDETRRWNVQSAFWEAVAETCRQSSAIFCYDLMNEPVVTEDKKNRDWTPGAFGDRYFVQRITLDLAGRTQFQIAETWVNKLIASIRKHDPAHLVTIGAIPWALTWPNAKPLFYSKEVSRNLDFVSLHFYPKSEEIDKAIKALAVYDIGKPIVIEETFPLSCSLKELDQFIERSRSLATGWIGFYWGQTIPEYNQSNRTFAQDLTLKWLEYFTNKTSKVVEHIQP